MTSQLPTKQWHEHLADQTIADAILDRILNNAHRVPCQRVRTRANPDTTKEIKGQREVTGATASVVCPIRDAPIPAITM